MGIGFGEKYGVGYFCRQKWKQKIPIFGLKKPQKVRKIKKGYFSLDYAELFSIKGEVKFYIIWVEMAHKKAAGSVKNLKDSQPKYRGVKVFGGQPVLAGNIIIRQKGSKYECGKNTYESADFSVHASVDGVVAFRKKNFKKFNGRTYLKTVVDVLPVNELVN